MDEDDGHTMLGDSVLQRTRRFLHGAAGILLIADETGKVEERIDDEDASAGMPVSDLGPAARVDVHANVRSYPCEPA